MAAPNTRDSKLIQYLNEAYGKEKELEVALQAHIGMTTRAPYKKRLREHLKETKAHGRERRADQAARRQGRGRARARARRRRRGGRQGQEVASKGLAAAKGPLHAIRGTGEAEKMLKNAKTEFSKSSRRSPPTPRSRPSPRPWATRTPPSSPRRSGARRSAWPASSSGRSPRWPRRWRTEEIPASERRRTTTRRRSAPSRNGGASASSGQPAATADPRGRARTAGIRADRPEAPARAATRAAARKRPHQAQPAVRRPVPALARDEVVSRRS